MIRGFTAGEGEEGVLQLREDIEKPWSFAEKF